MQNSRNVQLAADALKNLSDTDWSETTGIILGTGLGNVAAEMRNVRKLPFAQIPGFPHSGAQSHAGVFIFGYLNGAPTFIQQGRCHLYEGRTPFEICMGCRAMGLLGIKTLIITNAAGALNPLFEAGEIMCISDIINHTGVSPLTGDSYWGERFPDMSAPFDAALQTTAIACSLKLGIRLERGVYIGVHGPEMETPAETRMYRQWGADAIGMSTALEVIAARDMGMDILGLSCLTNKNLPDCMRGASIDEVISVAEKAGAKLGPLLKAVCSEIYLSKKRGVPLGDENLC